MRKPALVFLASAILACGGGSSDDGMTSLDPSAGDGDGATESEASGTDSASGTSSDGSTSDGDSSEATGGDGDESTGGDGDGDTSSTGGDGDGDTSTTGSGDGDGDGDSDTAASGGDGDGDTSTTTGSGDGDGDTSTTTGGDGDGDTSTTTGGDGDGDTTTSTTTGGDGDGDQPCFVENPIVELVPPNVIFVLDKSGSMMASAGGGDTRWDKLHQTVVSVVTTHQDEIAFGAKQFGSKNWAEGVLPNNINQQCAVDAGLESDPQLNNLAGILGGIEPEGAYISPYCLTPGQQGFERAVEWLDANAPDAPNALILVMDGFISDGRDLGGGQAPDCGDTVDGLTASIADTWDNKGWPVYVVGVDIEQSVKAEMDGYAVAGGHPTTGNSQFYDTSAGSGLTAALEAITGEIASCTIALSAAPPLPDETIIAVDGVEYPQITEAECATTAGWYYSDAPTNTTVELCGAACDNFLLVSSAEVQYFCDAG